MGKSLEQDIKNKAPSFAKLVPQPSATNAKVMRHLPVSYPSVVRITIIDGTPTEITELGSEEYIYDLGDVETDEEPTSDDVGLNCINQTPSNHLSVVRCTPPN